MSAGALPVPEVVLATGGGWGEALGATVFSGALPAALAVAALAGLVAFASPCVLPLVPGYLAYLSGMSAASRPAAGAVGPQLSAATGTVVGADTFAPERLAGAAATADRRARRRTVAGVLLFVAGFSVDFVLLGVAAGGPGGWLVRWSGVIERVAGVVVAAMGLAFLGAVPWGQTDRRWQVTPAVGLWGAPVLGLSFGLGWTPCMGPTLAAIYALALDSASAGRGAVVALAYCAGLGVPFVALAFGLQRWHRAVRWLGRHQRAVQRAGGAMLLLLGVALLTGAWGALAQQLQGWVGGVEVIV